MVPVAIFKGHILATTKSCGRMEISCGFAAFLNPYQGPFWPSSPSELHVMVSPNPPSMHFSPEALGIL